MQAREAARGSVKTEEYRRHFELEDRYWWFVSRQSLIKRAIQRFCPKPKRILDVGSGTGAVYERLNSIGELVVGVDVSDLALEFSAQRGNTLLVCGDAAALPFQSETFDAAVALDCLEHVEDDAKALQDIFAALAPGGSAFINVPAYAWLWSQHDVALMHHRRYTMREAKQKLKAAGFEIVHSSYSIFFLFPIVLLFRAVEKLRKSDPEVRLPKVPDFLNSLLIKIQQLEAWLLLKLPLPYGSSIVIIARKPKG